MKRKFLVYYKRNTDLRFNPDLTVADVLAEKTHVYLKEVYAEDVEQVFFEMQGENWSPNGEARELIMSKGLRHTSMSVGDAVVDREGRVIWQAAPAGWKEVRKY